MKLQIRSVLLVAGLLYAWPTPAADSPGVEERLKKLETQLDQVVKENTELKKQLGWDGKKSLNLVEDKGKAGSVGIGGYIQTHFGAGNTPSPQFTGTKQNDTFQVRRARVNVFGKFAENFDFMFQSEFAGTGSDMGGALTDGYINWNRYEAFNVKAGQYKTHFGYEQLMADTATLTIERSYLNDRLTASRQIGASITGSVLEKRLSYAAGIFNGNNVNNGFNDGNDFMGTARIEGIPVKTKVGQQDVTWALGVNGLVSEDTSASIKNFGFQSGAGKKDNLFAGKRAGVGVDSQFAFGPVGLQGEYLLMNYQPDNGNWTATTVDDDFTSYGYCLTATYDILPKKLTAVLRWESSTTDDNMVNGKADADVLVAGLNWYLKGDNLKLMANYLYGQIEGKDWESRFLARLQVAF